jgi:hypothetical protein
MVLRLERIVVIHDGQLLFLPNNIDSRTVLRQEERIDAHGADRHSEFQKNVPAVSTVLRQVPTGTHVTILGTADDSCYPLIANWR